jgi:hypothetical protein
MFVIKDTVNPLLNVRRGFVLRNLRFYWPDQLASLSSPIVYPAAIIGGKGTGDDKRAGGLMDGLVFHNAYEIFDFGDPLVAGSVGRLHMENIQAFALKRFFRALGTKTTTFMSNISVTVAHFPMAVPDDGPTTYAQQNCVLIETDECDGLKVHNFQAYQCNTFLKLAPGETVLNLAEFSNVSLDSVPELMVSQGSTGVNNCIFSNCTFRCVDDATGNGQEDAINLSYDRGSSAGSSHSLTFTGCVFRGAMRRFLWVKEVTNRARTGIEYLRFHGCMFLDWGRTTELSSNIPALDLYDSAVNLEVQDCTFIAAASGSNTMQGVRVVDYKTAKITNCSFFDCYHPLVVYGNGQKLMVAGNITTDTGSNKSLTLVGSAPSVYLVSDNLFDKTSDL